MEAKQTSANRRSLPEWLWYGVGGFSAGVLLAVLTVGLPLLKQVEPAARPQPTVAETPSPLPTSISAAAEATQVELHAIIEAGCQYLSNETIDPPAAIEVITAHLQEITDHTDLVRAYECLATAEAMLQHFQMAASYFDELNLLEPSAEYLYYAAQSYDNGGDLRRALEKYLLVLETDDPDAQMYQDWALERSMELQDILQHPHPTASPSPNPTP